MFYLSLPHSFDKLDRQRNVMLEKHHELAIYASTTLREWEMQQCTVSIGHIIFPHAKMVPSQLKCHPHFPYLSPPKVLI